MTTTASVLCLAIYLVLVTLGRGLVSVGDVIRYSSCHLGIVTKTRDEFVMVHPLCVRNNEVESAAIAMNSLIIDRHWIESNIDKKELHLYYDDDELAPFRVKREDIQKVFDGEVAYTQRVIEDRISNPHGEHAEELWILKVVDLIGISLHVRENYH